MADTVVVFMIEKLTRLLAEEAKLLSGVRDKITSLQSELKFMNVFLKNSQGKRKQHDIVDEVVSQIRDVAHEVEDVIDTYVSHMIKHKRRTAVERIVRGGGIDHASMLHALAGRIERIKTTINEIYHNKLKYGIEEGSSAQAIIAHQAAESLRRRRREVEEEEVVGFVHDSRVVIKQLVENDSCARLHVVSIIGMGGLGKTTLARKIYNSNRVKNLFPSRAWGYVSNDYRPKEFFLSLLKCLLSTSKYNDLFKKRDQLTEDDKPITEEELKMKVRKCLNKKKYLVVVDDVWQTQVWKDVKGAFPDDNNGSRILITSRSKEVASCTGLTTLPYYLPFLGKEESWELLSKKVFLGEECPPELVPLGKLIAESCDGLPLAIIVMAGILANKKSERDWSRIKDHVNWHLARDETKVRDILKLSYDSLPSRLKPCFLYFGIYPEDYEIPVKQLTQLWISEGLIQEDSRIPNPPQLEYVVEEYLDELVDRSLVQVASRRSDGGVKTCRIHDLLRDLCIFESRDDKFFEVCGEIDVQNQISSPRRLSLHGTLFHFSSSTLSDYSISGTRSLLCFGQEVYKVKPNHWRWLLKSFKLARVLDLGRMNVNSLPSDLEELIHLRYLRIHSYKLQTIPSSICSLWNLETLDLRGSPIKAFSREMWHLKRLRHLLMFGPVAFPNMSSSDSNKTMPNLQTLSTVALDPDTSSLIGNRRFPKLTKLGLYYEKRDKCHPRIQLQSLHHLNHLCTLKVIGTSEIPPLANVFPSNVTKITITKFGFFNSNAMNTLGKLTNLQILKLSLQKNDNSFDIHCANGGFLKLQVFEMVGINVKRWTLDKGSMPRFQCLVVKSCKSLTELPKELWSLTSLREVQVWWPCTELANQLQNLKLKNIGCKLNVYPHPTNEELDFV
ncbi:Winged helix-like DNA-binding domain superfamily [Sesbania bispinosa]|nr:Winged helix-like DNA-binding domain superfamily [Sesbania bispinosa]